MSFALSSGCPYRLVAQDAAFLPPPKFAGGEGRLETETGVRIPVGTPEISGQNANVKMRNKNSTFCNLQFGLCNALKANRREE